MDALEVETSIAAGEQALQALITCARERAGTLEAHEAEQGIFKRLLPMGLAAMKRSFAQCGTGDVGPAVTRADGASCRGRRRCEGGTPVRSSARSRWPGPATAQPGEPGSVPLDAQVNLPERCDSYVLQEWMTWCAVEPPFKERASWFEPCFALELAESVLMEVAQEAPEDYERFSAQRPVAPEESAGALLVVRVDGKGVPMMKAEAVTLKATWGTGEKRQRKKAALVGVCDTVDAKPRVARGARGTPGRSGSRTRTPAASRHGGRGAPSPPGASCGQPGADEAGGDGADQGRRGAPGYPSTTNLWSSCSMAPSACGTWRPSAASRGSA